MSATAVGWRRDFVLAHDVRTPGQRTELYAAVRSGSLTRLFRGAYMRTNEWAQLDRHGRYRAFVLASALVAPEETVFSHESAASMWGLPSLGDWPDRAHVAHASAPGGRSSGPFFRHTTGIPSETAVVDGVLVTSLAKTVVDIAARSDFASAVVVADAALHRTLEPVHPLPLVTVSQQELLALADSLPLRHGSAKAVAALTFADGRADRPGESISRVNMFVAGLPLPELQVELKGASGKKYTVDTYWGEFDKIGEFDGRYKYTDPRFMNGRTAEQVVLDEKDREDDLRAAGHGFTRWPWSVAISPERLSQHLRRAGIR